MKQEKENGNVFKVYAQSTDSKCREKKVLIGLFLNRASANNCSAVRTSKTFEPTNVVYGKVTNADIQSVEDVLNLEIDDLDLLCLFPICEQVIC